MNQAEVFSHTSNDKKMVPVWRHGDYRWFMRANSFELEHLKRVRYMPDSMLFPDGSEAVRTEGPYKWRYEWQPKTR